MSLLGFIDTEEDRTTNAMLYSNYVLQDCSVHYLGFTQIFNPVTTFEVLTHAFGV
jgi:hypothetical protein